MANGMLGQKFDPAAWRSPVTGPQMNPYYWRQQRGIMDPNDPMQAVIAPIEHREYARNLMTYGSPLLAPAAAAAIPAYTGAKRIQEVLSSPTPAGLLPYVSSGPLGFLATTGLSSALNRIMPRTANTSPASLDEIFAGYEGLLSGLKDKFNGTK